MAAFYKQGSLVIFFTNFLALLIKAGVADPDSKGSAAYAVALIAVNTFFVAMSIWWNTWITIQAMFSQKHVQVIFTAYICAAVAVSAIRFNPICHHRHPP